MRQEYHLFTHLALAPWVLYRIWDILAHEGSFDRLYVAALDRNLCETLSNNFRNFLPLCTRDLESVRASDGAIAGVFAGAVSAWREFSLWRVEEARSFRVVPVLVVDRYPSIHPIFIGFVCGFARFHAKTVMSLRAGYAFLSCSAFVMQEGESDDQTMLGVFCFVFTRGKDCPDRIFSISKLDDSLDFPLCSLFWGLLSLSRLFLSSVELMPHIHFLCFSTSLWRLSSSVCSCSAFAMKVGSSRRRLNILSIRGSN